MSRVFQDLEKQANLGRALHAGGGSSAATTVNLDDLQELLRAQGYDVPSDKLWSLILKYQRNEISFDGMMQGILSVAMGSDAGSNVGSLEVTPRSDGLERDPAHFVEEISREEEEFYKRFFAKRGGERMHKDEVRDLIVQSRLVPNRETLNHLMKNMPTTGDYVTQEQFLVGMKSLSVVRLCYCCCWRLDLCQGVE